MFKAKPITEKPTIRKKNGSKPTFALMKGARDHIGEDYLFADFAIQSLRGLLHTYDFQPMRTPLVESADLYEATEDILDDAGEAIEIKSTSSNRFVLRKDLLSGIFRAYSQNEMSKLPKPVKLYAEGDVFASGKEVGEELPKTRQVTFTAIGSQSAATDSQMIQIIWHALKRIGLTDVVIEVNSLGCPDCLKEHVESLKAHYRTERSRLCVECKKHITKSPLKIFKCAEDKCKGSSRSAPQSIDNLCEECHRHLKEILEFLDEFEIAYILNPQLVKNSQHYNQTIFNILIPDKEGNDIRLGEGGRFGKVLEKIGSNPTPATAMTIDINKVVRAMREQEIKPELVTKADVFLAQLGQLAKRKASGIYQELYTEGVRVTESFGRNSIKSQLRLAEKLEVRLVLILGQKEAVDGTIIVRDAETGIQEIVSQENFINEVKKRLGKEPQKTKSKKDD